MKTKQFIRDWCPPILMNWIRSLRANNGLSFSGDYASWSDAKIKSSGYDAEQVLQRVSEAALKVKRGEALFERDSVCFEKAEFRWPVLACMLSVAASRSSNLNVLDFGGSLGSFYFQHKDFFSNLMQVRWAIVEQAQFVKFGQEHLQDDVLRFYDSIESCSIQQPIDVVLLSSVIQYLEKPREVLSSLAAIGAPYILIDRTSFIAHESDRLTVQTVPKAIYDASYPAWFFSEKLFLKTMLDLNYRLQTEFPCPEVIGLGEYKGMFFERV